MNWDAILAVELSRIRFAAREDTDDAAHLAIFLWDLVVAEQIAAGDFAVDGDLDALGLEPLHDALHAAGAEVVGAGFHDQAVDAHHFRVALERPT